jgi:hypothetical protein
MDVRDIQFRPTADDNSGELGQCSVVINGLSIIAIRVRRTLDGRYVLAFPKIFHRGHERTVVLPLAPEDRRQVADVIFADLRRRRILP